MGKLKDEIEKILIDCDRIDFPGGKQFYRKEALDRITKTIIKEGTEERSELRSALKWFANLMEEDLKKNDFKGGWLDGKLEYYWGKALKHIMELSPVDSVRIGRRKWSIGQCFKAANYLMMFAHNIEEELRKGAKPKDNA